MTKSGLGAGLGVHPNPLIFGEEIVSENRKTNPTPPSTRLTPAAWGYEHALWNFRRQGSRRRHQAEHRIILLRPRLADISAIPGTGRSHRWGICWRLASTSSAG